MCCAIFQSGTREKLCARIFEVRVLSYRLVMESGGGFF